MQAGRSLPLSDTEAIAFQPDALCIPANVSSLVRLKLAPADEEFNHWPSPYPLPEFDQYMSLQKACVEEQQIISFLLRRKLIHVGLFIAKDI